MGKRAFRAASVMTMALAMGACSTLGDKVRPDIAAKPTPSRLDEIAYINVLRSALVEVDKQGLDKPQTFATTLAENSEKRNRLENLQQSITADVSLCYDGRGLERFKSKLGEGLHNSDGHEEYVQRRKTKEVERANKCLTYRAYERPEFNKDGGVKAEDRPQINQMETYLAAGFGLTDIYCNRFFTTASASAQNRQYFQDLTTGVDAMVGSILNFSGVGKTAIGITNSAFGGIGDGLQAYDAAYLVAPDLAAVQKLVEAAQGQFRAKYFVEKEDTRKNLFPRSYPAARSVIERYASLCSFTGMRQLVNKSITDETTDIERRLLNFTRQDPVTNFAKPPEPDTQGDNVSDQGQGDAKNPPDTNPMEVRMKTSTPVLTSPIG